MSLTCLFLNVTKDLNINISSIQYNFLNLPTSITYSSGKSASYIYNGAGEKLRTSYKASASATAVPTDYCGNMIYENNVLKQILIDGGYITFSGTIPNYFYYLKDHLGNNRVVVSPSGTPLQVNHYYPFGGLFGESTGNSLQRFRFNGKEFDRTHGIDWYDYGARHMTPDAGRFTTIDPMAEKYYSISPYPYCGNNPMRYIDMNGEEPGDFFRTKDEAAKDFGLYYNDNSVRINREFASFIFEIKDDEGNLGYSYSIASIGDNNRVIPQSEFGANNVATIHTHAAYDPKLGLGNDLFSGSYDSRTGELYSSAEKCSLTLSNDIGNANVRGLDSYLVTPSGSLQKYNIITGRITVISNEMPSDVNDPNRINQRSVEENNYLSVSKLLLMQEKINNGILNSRIK